MITFTSNSEYGPNSKIGFSNRTSFNFSILATGGKSFQKAKYIWNDDSKPLETTSKTAVKVFSKPNTYKVSVVIDYLLNQKLLSETFYFEFQIFNLPSGIFKILKTTRNNNDPLYARATKFSFIPETSLFGTNFSNIKYIQWDLGNGVISNKTSLSNVQFDSAGMFEITMVAHTLNNIKYTEKQIITIQEFVNDSIRFSRVPPPTFAGHLNRFPFQLEITSPVTNGQENIVDLYAQFSRSYDMLDNPTKNSFLRPEWKFLNTSFVPIREIKTKKIQDIRINEYGETLQTGGFLVGVKETAEFYFVDDWYNQDQVINNEQYTTIWATLRSNLTRNNTKENNIDSLHPSHANNTAQTWCPYVTLWRQPDTIKYTRNGVNPLNQNPWKGSDLPFTITLGYSSPIFPDNHNIENSVRLSDRDGGFAHYIPALNNSDIPIELVFTNNQSSVSSFLTNIEVPYIRYKDNQKLLTGGYYKNTYNSYTTAINSNFVTSVVQFSAKIEFNEPNLEANNYNPNIWILNPATSKINIAQYIFTRNQIINSPQYFYTNSITSYNKLFTIQNKPIPNVKTNKNMDTCILFNTETEKKKIPHVSSVFDNKGYLNGLHSVAALNFPTYHAWISDIELDNIYRVTCDGKIYKTINLKNLKISYNSPKLTPNNLVLDKNLNLFVGLIGSRHILKFNDNGTFLGSLNLDNIIPVSIDVDIDNNLYISGIYRDQTKKSVLLKYDNTLTTRLLIREYNNCFLGNILVSPDYKLYVVNNGHLNKDLKNEYASNSYIEVVNTTSLTTLRVFDPLPNIKHLSIDKNNSIIFNYGFNSIAKINNTTIKKVTLKNVKQQTDSIKNIIEGLSYNINEKIYVINSLDNLIHVINNITFSEESFFYINPSNILYKIDTQGQLTTPLTPIETKTSMGIRSNGDFIGWRWNYKYNYRTSKNKILLTQTSPIITFNRNNSFKVFNINENFDMAKYMYDISHMKTLKESPFLYNNAFYDDEIKQIKLDETNSKISPLQNELNTLLSLDIVYQDAERIKQLKEEINENYDSLSSLISAGDERKGFLGSIFGTFPYSPDDLGVSSFSKIANYVSNVADPDFCEIKNLYDIMAKIDYNDETYKIKFPNGISRVVDFLSISPKKLIGVTCRCGDTFKLGEYSYEKCKYCNKEKTSNRGKKIEDINYLVNAGKPVVLKYKNFKSKYRKINTGLLNNLNTYTITELATSIGLPSAWYEFYEFYEYIPISNSNMVENYIDWNNPQTTITKNQNIKSWYDSNMTVDRIIDFELQKGLELI